MIVFISKWLAPEEKKKRERESHGKPSGTEGRRGEQKQTEEEKIAEQVTLVVRYMRGLFWGKKKMTSDKSAPAVGFCAR